MECLTGMLLVNVLDNILLQEIPFFSFGKDKDEFINKHFLKYFFNSLTPLSIHLILV